MATDVRPLAFISPAALVTAASSRGMKGPAIIFVAAFHHPHTAAHQLGQVLRPIAERGSEAEAGMPSRSAATLLRCRRWTTALMKCVVPIITPSMRLPESTPVEPRLFSEVEDARGHILAGRRLHGAHHLAFLDQDGVGVGAAHVNANASHASNNAPEVDVIAESARTDMIQAARRKEDGGRGKAITVNPLAVTNGLAADGLARHRVEHADQVGRHGQRLVVTIRHDPLVLEVDGHGRAAPVIEPIQPQHARGKKPSVARRATSRTLPL